MPNIAELVDSITNLIEAIGQSHPATTCLLCIILVLVIVAVAIHKDWEIKEVLSLTGTLMPISVIAVFIQYPYVVPVVVLCVIVFAYEDMKVFK